MKADKQSRLTPKLRFPEFRDAPEWEEKAIDEIARVTQGGTPDTSVAKYWGGPINWLTPAEMGKADTPYIRSTARTLTDLGLKNCSSELLPEFSVIVSTRAPIGHLAINTSPMAINQGCRGLVITKDSCADFIYSALAHAKPRLNDLGAGNTFKELSGSVLKSFRINIPSLAEQQKIADCLGSLDDLIAAEGEKLEALRRHKQGLMQQLFPQPGETVPRLRFPEFRAQGAWELTNLSKLGKIQSGSTPSKANPAFWSGSIPWVSAKDMKRLFLDNTQDHISSAAVNDGARLVPAGTILILTRGMTLLNVVPICVLRREMSFNQDVKALRPNVNVHGLFLAFLLLANEHRLLKMVDIAGHGTGKLNTDELEAFELALPQLAEQQRIADSLSSLDDRIVAQARRIEALKTHKQGLLQQLFPSPEGNE